MNAARRAERRGDYARACALPIRRDNRHATLELTPGRASTGIASPRKEQQSPPHTPNSKLGDIMGAARGLYGTPRTEYREGDMVFAGMWG